jgi:hypothetical protein
MTGNAPLPNDYPLIPRAYQKTYWSTPLLRLRHSLYSPS